jgi:hypothetical protein
MAKFLPARHGKPSPLQPRWRRLAQAFHRELDIIRLEMAPALDFRLVAVLREPLEVFSGELPGVCAIPSELLAEVRVSGHAPLKRSEGGPATGGRSV